MSLEIVLLWSAVAAYGLAGTSAVRGVVSWHPAERLVLALLAAGLACHAVSLGLRWERIGHGPFITMHEILSSNLFSLTAIFAVAASRMAVLRPTASVVLPLLAVIAAWLLATDPKPGYLPPTYETGWLYVHVGFGKLFLGAVVVAVGLSGVVLLRSSGRADFRALPASPALDELAYRFLAGALVAETLMLVAGAIWAQDAWGRAWAWDPLETWAFLTWLLLAFALHVRSTLRPPPAVGSALAIAVFVLAFLTFFGVPFVTRAPHQGVM